METLASYLPKASNTISIGFKEIGPYYWIGECINGVDYYAGQTFKSPANGTLKRIKIFSSIVFGESNSTLSVYEFDAPNHNWKQKRCEVQQTITKAMEGQWISFNLPEVEVNKDSNYAFKITCKNGGMLAIAECPWNLQNPYPDGEEWIGSSVSTEGNFHKDFDLAFEAEIES